MLTGSRSFDSPFSRTVTATPVQHFVRRVSSLLHAVLRACPVGAWEAANITEATDWPSAATIVGVCPAGQFAAVWTRIATATADDHSSHHDTATAASTKGSPPIVFHSRSAAWHSHVSQLGPPVSSRGQPATSFFACKRVAVHVSRHKRSHDRHHEAHGHTRR